jgi:hypothetical protein
MKRVFIVLVVVVFNFLLGIGQDVSVFTSDNGNITTILAKNTSTKLIYSVTINLNSTGYKITQAPPFEVTLKPGEEKEVVKLIEKPGEKISLEYQVSYKKVGGQSEPNLDNLVVMPKDTIYVFSGKQCSRSEQVVMKLKDSKKIFKELSLGENDNYTLLQNVLAAQLKPGQVFNFFTPIVVVESVPMFEPQKVDFWLKGIK